MLINLFLLFLPEMSVFEISIEDTQTIKSLKVNVQQLLRKMYNYFYNRDEKNRAYEPFNILYPLKIPDNVDVYNYL